MVYSYDPACEELARYFLKEEMRDDFGASLAQHIQDAIEEWLAQDAAERQNAP